MTRIQPDHGARPGPDSHAHSRPSSTLQPAALALVSAALPALEHGRRALTFEWPLRPLARSKAPFINLEVNELLEVRIPNTPRSNGP